MANWVVGADLGATKIALGLIDPQDRVLARRRIPTWAEEGPQAVVERIAAAVTELEAELPSGGRLAALGICCPGPVDHASGMLIDPPNIQGLHHAPLRRLLTERLGMPVCLEHDAKAAALGEFHHGAGRGERGMVYIVVGTGVGAAIIADGQLFRGAHNAAGEIGHVTIDPQGDLCSCGSRGCVETFTAGPWLARRYQRAGGASVEGRELTGEIVTDRARRGDAIALGVMAEAGQALGIAVATLAMVLDIGLYVVGGSVAQAGDLLLDPARRMVPRCSYRSVSGRVRLVASPLGVDAPILGCGWLARQLLSDAPGGPR
jgi:glucokinase